MTTTRFLAEIDQASVEELKTVEKTRANIKRLKADLHTANAKRFLQALADAYNAPYALHPGDAGYPVPTDGSTDGSTGAYYDEPSIYTASYNHSLSVRVRVYRLSSFKDDPLLHSMLASAERLLELYPPVGLQPADRNPETTDYAWSRPNREYRYALAIPLRARNGQQAHINVSLVIDAYVSDDSATCHIVEKEIPVPAATRTERVIVCN